MRIDFAVVGAQKAGTTALRAMLRSHPALAVPAAELHVFDRRVPPAQTYRAHFPRAARRLRGDVTPIYMYWADCPERIKEHNPEIKVVAVLRCPVERAWSHWQMEHARGADALPFSEAIRQEKRRLGGRQHKVYSYADRGRYGWQVDRLLSLFGSNALFVKYEEYRRDHQAVMSRIFDFLAVEDMPVRRFVKRASRGTGMLAGDRRYLAERLEPEARRIEALLGWHCADWCRLSAAAATADAGGVGARSPDPP